jgi:glycine betaine/proline transport system ATP-binding protein
LDLAAVMQKTTLFITHDLDEAIRLGNRIAIMKDGVLVQIGTPEEIVTNPADDYVADFVAGISRLHLVYAHTIMKPLDAFVAQNPDVTLADMPAATVDSDLDQLIEIIVATEERYIRIMDGEQCAGVVTRGGLLRGIQGKED